MNKASLPLVATLLAMALCGCHKSPAPEPARSAPADEPGIKVSEVSLPIRTMAVTIRTLPVEKQAFATIEAMPGRSAELAFKTGGRIEALAVAPGDRVQKGQVLSTLSERAQARSQLEVADANIRRDEELFEKGIIARRQLETSRLQVQEARLALEGSQVVSPLTGVVTKRLHGPGEVVSAGEPVVSVADLSLVAVQANVFESDLVHLKPGQPVAVNTTAYPDRTMKGIVQVIAPALDPQSRTFPVRIRVPNLDRSLSLGMTAQVAIKEGERRALAVPSGSLLESPGGGKQVFVKEGDRYEARSVKPGLTSGGWTEIKEGLATGDLVVTEGQFELQSELNKGSIAQDDD